MVVDGFPHCSAESYNGLLSLSLSCDPATCPTAKIKKTIFKKNKAHFGASQKRVKATRSHMANPRVHCGLKALHTSILPKNGEGIVAW